MKKKITVCLLGFGRAGKLHLNSINRIEEIRLAYIVEPEPSEEDLQLIAALEATLVPEFSQALSDPSLDVVLVASPTTYHYQHITDSLKAGKHVFTEKPMGKSVKEIRACYAMAASLKKCLFLGFQRRYDTNFLALKESITEIEPIRTIKSSSRDNPKPTLEFLKKSGNIFHDMLIHDFDMLIHLVGSKVPESIFVLGHAYDPEIKEIDDYDTILVTIKYPDGLMCSIDTSRSSAFGYDQRIELFGTNGMAIADNQRENTVQLHTHKGSLKQPIKYSFPDRYEASYLKEVEHFIASIQNGILHNVKEQECLLSHLMAEAAHHSITTNQPVDFVNKFWVSVNP